MPKLSDIQSILLSTASQRETCSLYPLPDTLTPSAHITKAINALLKAGLAEEREVRDTCQRHRDDADVGIGVFATDAGLAAIGIGDGEPSADIAPPPPAPRASKRDAVIALLSRQQDATLAEIIAATDWLPHTARAALTGLRKKGHSIERGKRGDDTCYSVGVAA